MKEKSTRQSAAMKARMRRLRAQYRKRMIIVGVLLFAIGVAAGIFAHRWYASTQPKDVVEDLSVVTATPEAEVTPEPEAEPKADAEAEPEAEPQDEPTAGAEADLEAEPEGDEDAFGWDMLDETLDDADIFPEDEEETAEIEPTEVAAAPAEQPAEEANSEDVAFPEVEPAEQADEEPVEEAVEAPTEEAVEAPTEEAVEAPTEEAAEAPTEEAVETPAADLSSEDVAEYDPAEAEIPEEYLNIEDENGEAEADEAAAAKFGPQVIAIVPYGESFTYTTQIHSDGSARVEADDQPYESVSFTQTMKAFMRPTDFANKYSTVYKLQGNEAGAGFELVLNDYAGEATVVPQNVVDISLCSESGNTVERGYQLMDAEMGGNYNVALNPDEPKTLYKRYEYSTDREEMAYLVVTTYNDGAASQILFQLESDVVEEEPEIIYGTLQRGIKSDDVAALQRRLIELGYLSGAADGSFGQKTEDAIKAAQEAFGMEANGVADNAFQQKLYEGAASPAQIQAGSYETLNTSSTGEAVVQLQMRLRELGYYTGKADGGYGPMTESAVKKAQTAYGMEATGIADAAFQTKLYGADQP